MLLGESGVETSLHKTFEYLIHLFLTYTGMYIDHWFQREVHPGLNVYKVRNRL